MAWPKFFKCKVDVKAEHIARAERGSNRCPIANAVHEQFGDGPVWSTMHYTDAWWFIKAFDGGDVVQPATLEVWIIDRGYLASLKRPPLRPDVKQYVYFEGSEIHEQADS